MSLSFLEESSSFERNRRRQFEKRIRPAADRLYWEIIPGLKDISWVYPIGLPLPLHVELGALDRELGIDVIFTLKNGMRLTCQEKFAAPEFLPLQDITVEYYNDPVRRLPGDWFNLACQLYFFGFASKDYRSFDLWILVDWTRTVWETIAGNITWEHVPNHRETMMALARARLSSQEFRLVVALLNQTDGYLRDRDEILSTFWQAITLMSRASINHTLKRLVERRVVVAELVADKTFYRVNHPNHWAPEVFSAQCVCRRSIQLAEGLLSREKNGGNFHWLKRLLKACDKDAQTQKRVSADTLSQTVSNQTRNRYY